MKKILLLPVLLLILAITTYAQNIKNPSIENSDSPSCRIVKIESTPQFTIVSFEQTAQTDNSWARMAKEVFVQTNVSDKHYHYVKSENIAIAPEKTMIDKAGDKLLFKVYFERIPRTASTIDVIEKAGASSYFNFYNVSLTKSQGVVITDVVLSPPPINNANVNMGNNMSSVFNSMGPMLTNMATAMMDAQLTYYKQPGKIDEIAQLNKQYFDALIKAGFNADQALKIITSESLLPKAAMGGK
ncbi:MAG: hypothetical protein V4560_03295 [Bacteroidota bacterium]